MNYHVIALDRILKLALFVMLQKETCILHVMMLQIGVKLSAKQKCFGFHSKYSWFSKYLELSLSTPSPLRLPVPECSPELAKCSRWLRTWFVNAILQRCIVLTHSICQIFFPVCSWLGSNLQIFHAFKITTIDIWSVLFSERNHLCAIQTIVRHFFFKIHQCRITFFSFEAQENSNCVVHART